jgi:twitching motility protein PilT
VIDRILQAAVRAASQEIRLVPGRRIVFVTAAGEREVQGTEQTAASIDQLLGALLTPEAKQGMAAGQTEWRVAFPGVGPVGVRLTGDAEARQATLVLGNGALAAAAPPSAAAQATSAPPAPPAAMAAPQAPAVKPATSGATGAMDELFRIMVERKASDLHISTGSPPMLRHDGEIKVIEGRPALRPEDTQQLLWPIAPERNRAEFLRRHDTDFAYEIPGLARFRCNFFMDRKGMGGVFRQIPTKVMTAEEMGLSKEILQLCHLAKGLVLVTGPTGSGKSTTLSALIDYVNRNRTDHIITIEDPLEFVHENKRCLINQRQVGEHTDSFKDALRAALREDPDIVLVGEMRDLETVAIAIETAETGHLVFGTLHTSSAPSTVDRIIDQFPADRQQQIRVMLSESLKGVISQMLCKKIGGGRVPVLEVLIGTPPVANLIREAKIFQIPSIMQTSKKYGMCLMNESFTDLVKRKVVEPQEAYAKATDKTGLLNMFRKNGIDTSWAPSDPAAPAAPPPA